ncbi:MAG TPA: ATP-binding protein [Lacunisphaera sp.]|nr:ATP-binding protein [Lacunisphaera sp.]
MRLSTLFSKPLSWRGLFLLFVLVGGLSGPLFGAEPVPPAAPDSRVEDSRGLITLRRVGIAVGILAGCVLIGIAWNHSMRWQVRQQTAQMLEHMELQARRQTGLQNAARLESLGSLAGGIAHDYNNLLTVIMGNLALMKLSPRIMDTDEAHRLAEIERGIVRARDLTRQLLTFAAEGEPARAPTDLAEAVRTATERTLRGTKLQAEYVVEPGLWAGDGDRDQLIQVVQNVVLNAVQAMPDGGTLRLTLANEATETDQAGEPRPGRYVRIAISDEGEGIAADVLPRIFDPYFTTRRGLRGLGLATVYSVLNRHGGRVEANSSPGRGATVTLWVPATMQAIVRETAGTAPTAGAAAATPATTGKPRVLLMDDEEGVRELAAAVLERMGLEVTAVPDGERALEAFKNARIAARPYALLIVDLTVQGGMGGKETIEEVRKLDPGVPAIVSSGYSSDPVMANYQKYGFQAVVPKPFEVSTLAEAVKRFIPQAESF